VVVEAEEGRWMERMERERKSGKKKRYL